jgi:hypothetical protein
VILWAFDFFHTTPPSRDLGEDISKTSNHCSFRFHERTDKELTSPTTFLITVQHWQIHLCLRNWFHQNGQKGRKLIGILSFELIFWIFWVNIDPRGRFLCPLESSSSKRNCELSDANVFEEQTLDFDDWNVKQHCCCHQKQFMTWQWSC